MLATFITALVLLAFNLNANGFTCPTDGLYANPTDQHSFYQCSFGTAHSMPCPSGLVWNQNQQICDRKSDKPTQQRFLITTGSTGSSKEKCFDVAGGTSQLHAQIQLFRCHGKENQLVELPGDGTIRIMGKCFDIPDSYAVDHQAIQLFTCRPGQPNQQFTFDTQNRIHVMDKCVDIPNGEIYDNNPLQLFRCHNQASQRFTLVPI